jgi:hypothetical protein
MKAILLKILDKFLVWRLESLKKKVKKFFNLEIDDYKTTLEKKQLFLEQTLTERDLLKNANRTLTIQNVSLEEYLKKAIEDKDFLEEEIEKLKENLKRYELKVPKANITKLEQELKLCDTYTKRKIIEYLELDIFELVKNISGTVNNANSSDVINFMD